MKRFAMFAAVVFAVVALITGAAEAKFEKMSDQSYYTWPGTEVGRFAYTGSIREFMEASPCVKQDKAGLVALMEAASVPAPKYLEAVNASDLPDAEKQRLRSLAERRGFLFLYHLEQGKAPAGLIAKFGLKKTYELGELKDGEVCKCMPFTVGGVHKMRNVVYHGSSHPVLLFKTKTGMVRVDPRCNNGCFEPLSLENVHIPPDRLTVTEQLAKDQPCPNGWRLVANAWSLASLPADLQEEVKKHIEAARKRNSRNASNAAAYKVDDVSRTLGARLRRDVRVRALIDAEVQVFYRSPQTVQVTQNLGLLHLSAGLGSIQLPGDPRAWIIGTIWPKNFLSPTRSGGERRLWLFPEEWSTWCTMNVHGIVP